MTELNLFTAKVFRVSKSSENHSSESNNCDNIDIVQNLDLVESYHNMSSARVNKGKMIELEQELPMVGPSVKFKTIINYKCTLEEGSSLGVVLIPQDGYIAKPDESLRSN